MDTTINTETLETLIRSHTPMVLLDAREGQWDDGRRIPGAHICSPTISEDRLRHLVSSRDMLIVTYCGGLSCPLSEHLADRLRSLGYSNVLTYRQGIAAWAEAGKTIERMKAAG